MAGREAGRGVASSVTGQVFEKLIYYCIKNDFQLLASEQTCFQHIDNANKLAALCLLQEWVEMAQGGGVRWCHISCCRPLANSRINYATLKQPVRGATNSVRM